MVTHVLASNPGPLTLSGTNSYLIGSPAWLIDPGPQRPDHLDALLAAIEQHGGLAGIALTHHHLDHAELAPELRRRFDVPIAAAAPILSGVFSEPALEGLEIDTVLEDGARVGPLTALHTPGHAPDHFVFVAGRELFSGDTVLGTGSVFVAPGSDSLRHYLASLRRLRKLEIATIHPGHGPRVTDAHGKLDQYIAHRLDRERRLVEALDRGLRTHAELLDAAWSDAPLALRRAARLTLEAHLEKLAGEHRLPDGVERLDM